MVAATRTVATPSRALYVDAAVVGALVVLPAAGADRLRWLFVVTVRTQARSGSRRHYGATKGRVGVVVLLARGPCLMFVWLCLYPFLLYLCVITRSQRRRRRRRRCCVNELCAAGGSVPLPSTPTSAL